MAIIFWGHYHQPLDDFHYRCRWPKFEGLFNDFIGPGVLSAGQHYQAELRLLLFRRLQLQQPLNGSKQFVNRPFSDNHLLPEQFRATGLSLSWSSLFLSRSCLSCLFPLSRAWGSVFGQSRSVSIFKIFIVICSWPCWDTILRFQFLSLLFCLRLRSLNAWVAIIASALRPHTKVESSH